MFREFLLFPKAYQNEYYDKDMLVFNFYFQY